MKNVFRTALLGSAAAASLAAPQFAHAQSGQDVDVSEIVVTGSRIRRDTFEAPVPLATVTGDVVRASGYTSVGDVLTDMPLLGGNQNQQSTSSTLFLAGQARADIRGLGATRTLVLVDGRRHVYSDASSPAVDLNLFPSILVDRIDVVPGGGSAVYGSEAIAGVVNIILRKDLEGFEGDVQGGLSQEGDGAEFRIGAAYGGKALGDRLRYIVGGEVSRSEPIYQKDRDWAYPGIRRNNLVSPQTIIPNSRSNSSEFATFQLRGGAAGTAISVARDARDPTQIVRLSRECSTPTVLATCQDPALGYSNVYGALQGRVERGIIRGYAEYDLTDNVKAFGELSFARVEGYGIFQPAFSNAVGGGTMPVFITGDNAFLNGPGATAAQLRSFWTQPTAQGGPGLTLTQASRAQIGKLWSEFGRRDVGTQRDNARAVIGMNGKFNAFDRDMNWDWYAQYGELTGSTTSFNTPNLARVRQAVDAVIVNGQAVCRDVTARAAGCVPWDLVNGPSHDAVLWTNAQSTTDQKVKQTVVAGNFTTDLFQLPAGPLGFAIGAEYRKEESRFVQDALGASGALFINAVGTRAGEYDVKEAYAELRIPLLKDLPFAEELTVEAAGRISDYSSIGQTDQYRLAAEWAPVRDVRFRATQATAVRAPNIIELYAPQSRNFTTTAQDPCDKDVFAAATAAQQAARRVTCGAAIAGWNPATFVSNFGTGRSSLPLLVGGNPDLGPETATTYGLGVVIQPRWVPGLQVSLDFFKYNLEDQVSTLDVNTVLQTLCYDSTVPFASNPFCALAPRDASGATAGVAGGVSEVILTNQNVSKVKVEGYDGSIAYGFNTTDVFGADYGRLDFRVDATWMYRWAQQGLPGQDYFNFANHVVNATPEWKAAGTVQWRLDDLTLSWTTHYIGSMKSTNAFTETGLSPYYTGDYYTHDLRVQYQLNDGIKLRGGVLNLTDETPPMLPETYTGASSVGAAMFDNRGRYFYLGATLKY